MEMFSPIPNQFHPRFTLNQDIVKGLQDYFSWVNLSLQEFTENEDFLLQNVSSFLQRKIVFHPILRPIYAFQNSKVFGHNFEATFHIFGYRYHNTSYYISVEKAAVKRLSTLMKRKQPIPRIEDREVLGSFPIIVEEHVPYFVTQENFQKVTLKLINWLMGNTVNFNPEDIQKAIDFLFERDHERFLLLLSGKIKVEEFGPIFLPMVFFSYTPDVLVPYEFQRRRMQAQSNPKTATWMFSKLAEELKWISINGNPVPRDHITSGQLLGDVAERKVFQALQEYFYVGTLSIVFY